MPVSGGEVDAVLRLRLISDLRAQLKSEETALLEFQKLAQSTNISPASLSSLNPAIEESKVKIADLRAQLGNLAPAAAQAEEGVDALTASLERMLVRIAVVMAIRTIINFTSNLLESTSALYNLHLATDISLKGLQEMQYVGAEFGVSMEKLGKTVEEMGWKLSRGDGNATMGVAMLGLAVKDLVAAGPEEAFLRIGEAVGKLQDPMQRSDATALIFGQDLSKTLLPMMTDLRQKMEDAGKSSAIMADDTVKAAHDFDVALHHLGEVTKGVIAESVMGWADFARGVGKAFQNAEGDAETWGSTLSSTSKTGQVSLIELGASAADANKLLISLANEGLAGVVDRTAVAERVIAALRKDAIEPLTQAQKDQIVEFKEYGLNLTEIAQLVNSNATAVRLYLDEVQKGKAAIKSFNEAWEQLNSLGTTQKETLDSIDPSLHVLIEDYLKAGASVSQLAKAFPELTENQVKAVDAGMKAATKYSQEWIKAQKDIDVMHSQALLAEQDYEKTHLKIQEDHLAQVRDRDITYEKKRLEEGKISEGAVSKDASAHRVSILSPDGGSPSGRDGHRGSATQHPSAARVCRRQRAVRSWENHLRPISAGVDRDRGQIREDAGWTGGEVSR
jgi:hypothetical protein